MMDNDKKQDFEKVLDLLEKKGSSFAIATVIRTMSVSYTHLTLPTT